MSSYSIKQLELISGIKAHTIRMWERRYGLFSPQRTVTNIRRYNDQDVRLILNISLLLRNGYRISKLAAKIPEELSNLALNISSEASISKKIDLEPFILSLLSFNHQTFQLNLNEKIEEYGLEGTFENLIIPLLERIGILWQTEMIKPAHEHFASNIIRHTIISKIETLKEPDNTSQTIIFFLPEGEFHELGILFYSYLAKKIGVQTIYLGQSTPIEDVIEVSQVIKPKAIFTSISTSLSDFSLTYLEKEIKKKVKGCHIYITGYNVVHEKIKVPKEITVITSFDQFIRKIKSLKA